VDFIEAGKAERLAMHADDVAGRQDAHHAATVFAGDLFRQHVDALGERRICDEQFLYER
jgi:hypothetical protein